MILLSHKNVSKNLDALQELDLYLPMQAQIILCHLHPHPVRLEWVGDQNPPIKRIHIIPLSILALQPIPHDEARMTV
jgi:hypothetical protein